MEDILFTVEENFQYYTLLIPIVNFGCNDRINNSLKNIYLLFSSLHFSPLIHFTVVSHVLCKSSSFCNPRLCSKKKLVFYPRISLNQNISYGFCPTLVINGCDVLFIDFYLFLFYHSMHYCM